MRRIAFLAVVGTITLFGFLPIGKRLPSALSNDTSVEQRIFYRAEALFRKGKPAEALPDLQRVLVLNPHHSGALFFAGKNELEAGNLEKALNLLQKAEKDLEYGPKARQLLAEIKIQQTTSKAANEVQAYVENGVFDQGLKDGMAALSHAPRNPELLFQATFAAAMVENKALAEEYLERLEKETPNAPFLGDLKSLVTGWFIREESPDLALEYLLSIKNPKILISSTRRAIRRLLLNRKQNELFEKYLAEEIKRCPQEELELTRELAQFFLSQGQFEKGRQLLETQQVETIPDNLLFLELVYLSGQEERAMSLARRLQKTWPEDEEIRTVFVKGFIHYHDRTKTLPQGKDADGKTFTAIVVDEITRLVLAPPKGISALPFMLGARACMILGRTTDAAALAELSRKKLLDSASEAESLALAQAFSAQNLFTESNSLLRRLQANAPENLTIQVLLAENLCRQKQNKEALALLKKIPAKGLKSFKTFSLLVDCLAACGKTAEAHQLVLEKLDDPTVPELLIPPLKVMAFKLADRHSGEDK